MSGPPSRLPPSLPSGVPIRFHTPAAAPISTELPPGLSKGQSASTITRSRPPLPSCQPPAIPTLPSLPPASSAPASLASPPSTSGGGGGGGGGSQIGQWLSGGGGTPGNRQALTGSFQQSSSSSSSSGGNDSEKRNKIKAQYQFLDLFLKKRHTQKSVFGTSLCDLYKATNSPVPLIVLQCIEYLREFGQVKGIFRQSALMVETQALKEHFTSPTQKVDIAAHISEPHACAVVFKQFFSDLPEPIVPFAKYDSIVAAFQQPAPANVAALKQVVVSLPVSNLPTLKLLFEFLADFVKFADVTLMNAENLGIVFGPNLLRPKVLSPQVFIDRFDSKITTYLIQHYAAIFDDLDLREIGIGGGGGAEAIISPRSPQPLGPSTSAGSISSTVPSPSPAMLAAMSTAAPLATAAASGDKAQQRRSIRRSGIIGGGSSGAPVPTMGAETPPVQLTPSTRRATVLWDWVGQSDTEVSCRKNEIVTLLDNETTNDWRWIRTSAGAEGYIASSYLQEIASEGVSVPASLILRRRNTVLS